MLGLKPNQNLPKFVQSLPPVNAVKIAAEKKSYPRRSTSRVQFCRKYRGALRDYLEHRGDPQLRAASELGVIAQGDGMGLFDLAHLHEEALVKVMADICGGRKMGARQTRAAEIFLLEALSPFEAARRGLPEAYVRLKQITETLEQRNRTLATIDARHGLMEAALVMSKKRSVKLRQQAKSLKADILQHPAKVIQAQEDERKRVSRELHDEIGQALAAVNVGLGVLKKQASHDPSFQRRVSATQALLEQSMQSVHRFAQGLRPQMLDIFGPYEAIRTYLRSFSARTAIIAVISPETNMAGLDSEQEVVLFRVAQEAMTNISKHAQATRVDVRIYRLPGSICMEIQDNGRSFSVEEKLGKNKRLGLLGMQERVQLARGEFSIESAAGLGTKLRVKFPCSLRKPSVADAPKLRLSAEQVRPVVPQAISL